MLHGCARPTAALRRAIQARQERLSQLAARDGINPKTAARWRERAGVADAPMGPEPASTALAAGQEALSAAFRQHTLPPLDDCRHALRATLRQHTALHPASPPPTPRPQPPAPPCPGPSLPEAVQGLSHRLFPRGSHWAPHRRRQAPAFCGRRPHFQVRLRPAGGTGRPSRRRRPPAGSAAG